MSQTTLLLPPSAFPAPSAVLELLKPITWFAPMWAFMCGVVSSGVGLEDRWLVLLGGVVLAGPLICATSQAANDWFDRHVDAINEPNRPIPSGRIPGTWGLKIAIIWTVLSLAFATLLGEWVVIGAAIGLALSWAYSAPPLRLKLSGWWGPAAVAICYEGLAWFTGAAVMTGGLPSGEILALAGLYSLGAHGIMTLNDFKAVEGDAQMGVRSLPVTLGVEQAALLACAVMAVPQILVVGLLLNLGHPPFAAIVAGSVALQFVCMARLLRNPAKFAPWYNATGVTLFVLGMLAAAIAVGPYGGGA
jgi:chlorophyll synthase